MKKKNRCDHCNKEFELVKSINEEGFESYEEKNTIEFGLDGKKLLDMHFECFTNIIHWASKQLNAEAEIDEFGYRKGK